MPAERWLRALLLLLLSSVLPIRSAVASAEGEGRFPSIHGEILFELQNDWTFHSEDKDNERSDLYFTIEPSLSFGFTEELSLEAGLVLEPVFDPGRPGAATSTIRASS